mmetsp:Transcript_11794/g.33995  ORF Transcript_11794/g.33995 Transcript_11794/m.33995 type:complete len:1399 (+) Transcript_11794:300-4496(+)
MSVHHAREQPQHSSTLPPSPSPPATSTKRQRSTQSMMILLRVVLPACLIAVSYASMHCHHHQQQVVGSAVSSPTAVPTESSVAATTAAAESVSTTSSSTGSDQRQQQHHRSLLDTLDESSGALTSRKDTRRRRKESKRRISTTIQKENDRDDDDVIEPPSSMEICTNDSTATCCDNDTTPSSSSQISTTTEHNQQQQQERRRITSTTTTTKTMTTILNDNNNNNDNNPLSQVSDAIQDLVSKIPIGGDQQQHHDTAPDPAGSKISSTEDTDKVDSVAKLESEGDGTTAPPDDDDNPAQKQKAFFDRIAQISTNLLNREHDAVLESQASNGGKKRIKALFKHNRGAAVPAAAAGDADKEQATDDSEDDEDEGAQITEQSDLTRPGRYIHVVTTAALPWMTGTAVNPLLRAAYLNRRLNEINGGTPTRSHHEASAAANATSSADESSWVTLVIPWLELDEDQKQVYGKESFESQEQQEKYIRSWLRQDAIGLADAADTMRIVWYPARYHPGLGSVFAMGDIINEEELQASHRDVCILEEPEHCNWYRAPGDGWTKKYKYVVGIVHTNYKEYAANEFGGLWTAPALELISSAMIRAYTHKILKLSDVLQTYAVEKETTANVHGVRSDFFKPEEGIVESLVPAITGSPPEDDDETKEKTRKVYFIGKLVWQKGFDLLLDYEEYAREITGEYFPIDIYGSGPDETEIKRAYLGRKGIVENNPIKAALNNGKTAFNSRIPKKLSKAKEGTKIEKLVKNEAFVKAFTWINRRRGSNGKAPKNADKKQQQTTTLADGMKSVENKLEHASDGISSIIEDWTASVKSAFDQIPFKAQEARDDLMEALHSTSVQAKSAVTDSMSPQTRDKLNEILKETGDSLNQLYDGAANMDGEDALESVQTTAKDQLDQANAKIAELVKDTKDLVSQSQSEAAKSIDSWSAQLKSAFEKFPSNAQDDLTQTLQSVSEQAERALTEPMSKESRDRVNQILQDTNDSVSGFCKEASDLDEDKIQSILASAKERLDDAGVEITRLIGQAQNDTALKSIQMSAKTQLDEAEGKLDELADDAEDLDDKANDWIEAWTANAKETLGQIPFKAKETRDDLMETLKSVSNNAKTTVRELPSGARGKLDQLLQDFSMSLGSLYEEAVGADARKLDSIQALAKEKMDQTKMKISDLANDVPKSLHELRRQPIPATFPGRVDHATLRDTDYTVFVNPSISEVLCTTTFEALAMGKFAIIPVHPSNTFFLKFPNCLSYSNKMEFVANLWWAMTHDPEPLTGDLKREFTWEAATDRLIEASSITRSEALMREQLGKSKLDDRIAWFHNQLGKGMKGDMIRKVFGAGPVSDQVKYQRKQEEKQRKLDTSKAKTNGSNDDEDEEWLPRKFRDSSFVKAIRDATSNAIPQWSS